MDKNGRPMRVSVYLPFDEELQAKGWKLLMIDLATLGRCKFRAMLVAYRFEGDVPVELSCPEGRLPSENYILETDDDSHVTVINWYAAKSKELADAIKRGDGAVHHMAFTGNEETKEKLQEALALEG